MRAMPVPCGFLRPCSSPPPLAGAARRRLSPRGTRPLTPPFYRRYGLQPNVRVRASCQLPRLRGKGPYFGYLLPLANLEAAENILLPSRHVNDVHARPLGR